jgi:hypothetical protein
MISGPSKLDLITPVDRVALTQASNHGTRFIAGTLYLGEVIAQLDEHMVAVRLGGDIFSMKLGEDMTPGQMLTFKYLSADPRPSFLLLKQASVGSRVDQQVDISTASALINQYQHEFDLHLTLNHATEVEVMHSYLVDAPNNPLDIARELKNAISLSGLFYEAHLADFAEGKRSVDLIFQEPQNQTQFDVSQGVAKQLDVLEHQALRWSGLIWPGQAMDWTIAADEASGEDSQWISTHSQGLAKDVGITSTVELDFPSLHKVVARFNVRNSILRIKIEAADPDVEALLKGELRVLNDALKNSGQYLESLSVRPYE